MTIMYWLDELVDGYGLTVVVGVSIAVSILWRARRAKKTAGR